MSEHSESYPPLLQDEPIRSVTDDRYGRREYVRNLALALSRFPGPGSLVVGIQGPWGSGKTSLKNMLVEQLAAAPLDKGKRKKEKERGGKVIVVEFEPWIYSGSGRLVTLLFNQISLTLSGKLGAARHTVAKSLKRVANGAAPISDVAPSSMQRIVQAFGDLGEALEPDSQDLKRLSGRRENLKKELEKSAFRIVVFIDDLDRLMDDEVTDVMRAVKAVGDLPYMTYVLLYDRDSLTKSLDKSCHDKGDEYLEKIVQVPIGLPEPIKEVVLDRLKNELTKIVGKQNFDYFYDESISTSSQTVYESCVVPYIDNMRDVNRLISEFSLRYQVLKGYVEPADLLGITSLEVFRPDLHHWIMAGKDYLCIPDNVDPAGGAHGNDRDLARYIDSIQISNNTDARDLKAVGSLFPRVHIMVDNAAEVDRIAKFGWRKSICNPRYFGAYFRLSIGAEACNQRKSRSY